MSQGALRGTARALVRFTVSGERRSWARLVALIFWEPSGALAARQKDRPRPAGCVLVRLAAACRLRACPPSHRSRTLPRLLRGGVLALAAGVAHGGQRSAHGLAKPASSPRPARRCLAAIAIVCVPFALTGFAIRRQ